MQVPDAQDDPTRIALERAEAANPGEPNATDGRGARDHWVCLGLALAVVVLSLALRVPEQDKIVLPLLDGVALPELCTSRQFLGIPCPGCGMTRCFVSLAHGQIARAWSFNPAGLLLFSFVVLQIPYRMVQILRIRRGKQVFRLGNPNWFLCLLLVALLAQWIPKAVSTRLAP